MYLLWTAWWCIKQWKCTCIQLKLPTAFLVVKETIKHRNKKWFESFDCTIRKSWSHASVTKYSLLMIFRIEGWTVNTMYNIYINFALPPTTSFCCTIIYSAYCWYCHVKIKIQWQVLQRKLIIRLNTARHACSTMYRVSMQAGYILLVLFQSSTVQMENHCTLSVLWNLSIPVQWLQLQFGPKYKSEGVLDASHVQIMHDHADSSTLVFSAITATSNHSCDLSAIIFTAISHAFCGSLPSRISCTIWKLGQNCIIFSPSPDATKKTKAMQCTCTHTYICMTHCTWLNLNGITNFTVHNTCSCTSLVVQLYTSRNTKEREKITC